ncbi:MAG: exodeoxyribonuclease V subunit gamma [Cocleimonas sp.]
MLYIHTSNQLEQLKNQYATVVKTPLKDAFKAETVVVQNAGMARWLSMEMAQTSGISANTDFLFPAEFMWGLLRLVSPDIPEHSQCAPDTLRFHIFEELSNNFDDYPELHHYILKTNNTNDEQNLNQLSVWELSCQSARLLDQYLFYRSEWIYDWESSNSTDSSNQSKHNSNHWQARLWNRCVKGKGLLHWLALQDQFSQNIEEIDSSLLTERISFFSMSALSPGYVELLGGISQKTDIHIFIINPCEEVYWGDIRSPKSHAKLDGEDQAYAEIGNPLLASLGKQGQDFIDKLLEIPHEDGFNTFKEEQAQINTLLGQIQHDIYNLEKPKLNEALEKFDGSIQFNACHTVMREVEVLHDQILAQLDADIDLAPSDIVVMMPDIEKYAPYIESVFSSQIAANLATNSSDKKQQKLPFSIADRDPQNIFKIIQALNKLFALPDSRFDVEAVFELLEYDDIRAHFGLDENQLKYCRELALATNIRWGISAKTRKQNNLPDTEEHTWKYALDRMLLGYSLAGTESGDQLFKSKRKLDLLAYNEIEGSNALVLANFKKFTDSIFAINNWQQQSFTLDKWLVKTTQLIQQISPENSDQQRIFKTLADLQLKANLADFNQELPFAVYQKMLQQCLAEISANEKYLGYGITFCALVPMRSVPFKIVVLMGMNDGEFPRQETRPSFDLTTDQTRKGDRSRRDEDRYLFLESLLAARSKLIISYIGQSIKDNSDLAPSILISELLDTVTINSGTKAEEWIVKHPLQAFSSRYFSVKELNQHPLFSYASQYLQLDSKQNQSINQTFISEPLDTLNDENKHLTLDELINFYKNPARVFLKRRFSIQTFDNDDELQSREPFKIESFKNRDIRNLILADYIPDVLGNPNNPDNRQLITRAKGLLPYGQIGDEIYAKEKHTVEVFEEQLSELDHYADQHISLSIGEFQINAKLDQLSNVGRYVKKVSELYTGDYIGLWFTHLCLNAYNSNVDIGLKESQFHSPEISFQFNPVDDAQQQLKLLLDYYWQGLHFPLHFFPKSSFALCRKKGGKDITGMSDKWNGTQYGGEKDSFEHWLLHRDLIINKDEQPQDFLEISHDVFGRMFESLIDTNS